ncbi:hypothetical protein [Kitasatospora sp. NPDC056531]|uniref:hypothetical protein n=1 Tax=Kitasatospora sp. NPDC056531 TaxID=3345856 RepID=UPI0036971DAA
MSAPGDMSAPDASPLDARPEEPQGAVEPSAAPEPSGSPEVAGAPEAVAAPAELSPSELRALQEKLRAKFH